MLQNINVNIITYSILETQTDVEYIQMYVFDEKVEIIHVNKNFHLLS